MNHLTRADGVRVRPSVPDVGSRASSGPVAPQGTALAAHGIPQRALGAYQAAAAALADADPTCRLDWALLAGIGRVESNHGRFAGATVSTAGVSVPAVIGIRLDGTAPRTAVIVDSDEGRLDGDAAYDRAVGPMQFLPGSWATFGADGDGDGVRNPQDIDDAALAAGAFLCSGAVDLSTAPGASAAVRRYNNSGEYVSVVLTLAAAYRHDLPVGTVPAAVPVGRVPVLPVTPAQPVASGGFLGLVAGASAPDTAVGATIVTGLTAGTPFTPISATAADVTGSPMSPDAPSAPMNSAATQPTATTGPGVTVSTTATDGPSGASTACPTDSTSTTAPPTSATGPPTASSGMQPAATSGTEPTAEPMTGSTAASGPESTTGSATGSAAGSIVGSTAATPSSAAPTAVPSTVISSAGTTSSALETSPAPVDSVTPADPRPCAP